MTKGDTFGFNGKSVPEQTSGVSNPDNEVPMTKPSERELTPWENRTRDIIILLFGCRKEHHVKICADCHYWNNDNFDEHFIDCPRLAEQREIRRISHEMESELNLKNIQLPKEIYDELFPREEKHNGSNFKSVRYTL